MTDDRATERRLIDFFGHYRWPIANEKLLQSEIADKLEEAGIVADREVSLSAADIIDFMVDGVGVEIKIKGTKREIYRQARRYCEHEQLKSLLVVSNVAIGLPPKINEKPVRLVLLGRSSL